MTATATSDRTHQKVMYVQYTNPAAYPPVEHSACLLADAGWEVLLLGVAIPGTTLALTGHEQIEVQLLPPAAAGWRQKLHYARFMTRAVQKARTWRPDWVYASDALSCPIAVLLAASSNARFVYHEHDSPDEATTSRSIFMRMVLAARRRVAARAELCVLPNAGRTEAFRRVHPRARTVTIWNCPMRDEVHPPARLAASDHMRVLYHGSIVPARLPLAVIDALAILPPTVTLVVAGYETAGYPGYLETLRRRAHERGIADRVEFVGTVPKRADLLRQCAGCDVGLALMPLQPADLNEREMVGASNKPFDYMACGLALVVSDLHTWRAAFVDGGYAMACNPQSAGSIATVLRRLLEDPQLRRTMGDRGRQKILDDWNYERAFAPVLSSLNAGAEKSSRRIRADVVARKALSR